MAIFKVKVFIRDRRYKTGERLETTITTNDPEFHSKSYSDSKFRIEIVPATKIVKNLMSGKEIEIDYDTPLCCDPSSETYWSM